MVNRTTEPITFRVPPKMRGDLDQWLESINAARPYTRVTKNEVLVRLLEWALCTRPSLDELSRAAASPSESFERSTGAQEVVSRAVARASERNKKGAKR